MELKLSAELVVSGFIRIHCIHRDNCPMDIQNICFLMYFQVWDNQTSNKILSNYIICHPCENKLYTSWYDTVGTMSVIKGVSFIWKLKILSQGRSLFIGIIDKDTYKQYEGYIFPNRDNGYGFCTTNGRIYSKTAFRTRQGVLYANKCNENDVIRMELNMRQLIQGKYGTLSYTINDRDCGVAFNQIDSNLQYLMIVTLYIGDKVQLIP